MSSSVELQSKALITYDQTLPHISLGAHLESRSQDVEAAAKRSLDSAQLQLRWRERVVTRLAQGLSHLYIDRVMGSKMADTLIHSLRSGKYNEVSNPASLRQKMLDDLRIVCPDKHLELFITNDAIPELDPDRSLRTLETREYTVQQQEYLAKCAESAEKSAQEAPKFVSGSMIDGTKFGCLKIDKFPALTLTTKSLINTEMLKLMDAEAIIIDLTENDGGDPETVAFLTSYFFDAKQLVNQIYRREGDRTTSYYAEPEKLERTFGGKKPVFILTGGKTFSAAEEFAYDMQALKRGIVIGQRTMGGAHPVRYFVIDDKICVSIPYEKAVNPYTHTNWEGTGVIPDHLIKEEDAKAYALQLIQASSKSS